MFSKGEVTRVRSEFWITFGKYMAPVPSCWGMRINWINYKTGVKSIFIRMDASGKTTKIAIEITHKDEGIRQLFFEQFQEFKLLLESSMEEEWTWDENCYNSSGVPVSNIYKEIDGNIFDKDKWGDMFSFLKKRLIAFDEFWSDAKDIFKALES